MNPIKRVAIVGGTHGNELTGIYLVKKFERFPNLIERSSFESITLLANPKAYEIGRRYVDTDLNRCFQRQDLENPKLSSYEAIRAKAIYQMLASGGSQPINLVIDLHSSTANMGLTIIPSSKHPFNLHLAAHLTSVNPSVKVYRWMKQEQDSPFLRSIYEFGCAIEVGPIAQGVLNAPLFQQTEELIYAILDYVEAYNQRQSSPTRDTLTIYQCVQTIDYPRNEHRELQAMIHPQLQFRDYEALYPDAPMFLTFDGRTISYEGNSTVYPVFINEAAYYEKGIAMCLTKKEQVRL
ncbi:MAG TPA: aspartoacylase [Coleofasciculaceae cyanobacterium]|jgi:aspartoacylase